VIASLRRLAVLQSAAETETAYGGRTRVWSDVASLWVDLSVTGGSERSQAAQRPELSEQAKAEARDHPSAAAGQRLVIGGDNWRVVRLTRGEPKIGRMTLFLQKDT
jgi:head-tail adaptor